jgi:hypothetical protein
LKEETKEIYDKFKIEKLRDDIKDILHLSDEEILDDLGFESIDE